MLHKAAASLHFRMVESGNEPPSIPVIVYALEIIINTFSIFGLVAIIGLISGKFISSVTLFVVFSAIRFISGGYHLPTNAACIVVSTIVLSMLPHIHLSGMLIYSLNTVSFIMMLIFAPANYDKYARISPKYYPLMKLIACIFVGSNFFIGSALLSLAFMTQCLLLPYKGGEKE